MTDRQPRLTVVGDCGSRMRRRAARRRLSPDRAWRWFLSLFLEVFPMHFPDGPPTGPGPVPPIPKAAALREGALLYAIDGEPVARNRRR